MKKHSNIEVLFLIIKKKVKTKFTDMNTSHLFGVIFFAMLSFVNVFNIFRAVHQNNSYGIFIAIIALLMTSFCTVVHFMLM